MLEMKNVRGSELAISRKYIASGRDDNEAFSTRRRGTRERRWIKVEQENLGGGTTM